MTVFDMTMFPAGDGDCLLLSYGDTGALRHVLVDGGRASAYKSLRPQLARIAAAGEMLELFVLTHIDADHIEGALKLAEDPVPPIRPRQVWYNGYDQMNGLEAFGEAQGDRYSNAIAELEWPLNQGFPQETVSVETAPAPMSVGNLAVTILSPDRDHLAAMRSRWTDWRTEEAARRSHEQEEKEERERAAASGSGLVAYGRAPMPSPLNVEVLALPGDTDHEAPNGSSIAFIAEFEGYRVLMAGDAHPDLLAASLAPLAAAEGGRYRVDLFKVSHHGSRKNTTLDLVSLLDCRRFAISSNGNRHGHPDPEAIARLLSAAPAGRKELHFNYRTDRTSPWNASALESQHDYECFFPGESPGTLSIDVTARR